MQIDNSIWTLHTVAECLDQNISLSEIAVEKINTCRNFLDTKMQDNNNVFYGINTGFGSLCNVRVDHEDIAQLQHNLVVSHACGMGKEVPQAIVKIMLLLKIKNFVYGNSGVSLQLVQRLVDMYNNDVLPIIYEQGSLGASGDLAPLAHLSLPILGLGEVHYKGSRMASADALALLQWHPITLQSKEGLALLNGTQFMAAYACYVCLQAERLMQWCQHISAISIDAFDATLQPFSENIHLIRNHTGQLAVAAHIRALLKDSEIAHQRKTQVQDPYSFRCIPQVHGTSWDVIKQVTHTVELEINAVTDNPVIFTETDEILSGGNFHGQVLAVNLDYLAIALAELANISERRTYLLISGQRGLPAFLTSNAGLESGLMIAQYTAASIVSANKQLCTPASVDSIVSSNGQEDHVSMGANAATKLYTVLNNVFSVLGIELLTARQALSFRKPKKSGDKIEEIIAQLDAQLPVQTKDRVLSTEMQFFANYIATTAL
jgi:histidine ammonia-lyase